MVTPRAGVWIEIGYANIYLYQGYVTPRAGVWIEITLRFPANADDLSHSPCGSVD